MPTSIGHDELAAMLARDGAVVVEALGPDYYADGHLPGAINLPHTTADEGVRASLATATRPVVVYGSRHGPEAHELARRIEGLVGGRVALLSGGKEGWVEAGLSIERTPDA